MARPPDDTGTGVARLLLGDLHTRVGAGHGGSLPVMDERWTPARRDPGVTSRRRSADPETTRNDELESADPLMVEADDERDAGRRYEPL